MSSKSKALSALSLLLAGMAATPAMAEAGDTFIRVRGIMVAPNEDSTGIRPAFPAETVSVNNAVAPEVDITHMLTNNFGVELIAATTKHSISGTTGTTGTIGKLASTWVLPPTLTLQYHFAPEAKARPYVGAGVNWTLFYKEKASNGLEAAVGQTNVNLSSSFGWAAQAGIDIDLNEKMFLNLDVKYIDLDTNARLRTTAAGIQRVGVDINPFVFGVGVGFKL
ncbi:OmpW family protein [Sphingorhabdus sp.]|jgi:outer membrane protein|uniref:OmpW family protein n=1 Tax=Sphingorhabdus sp. TaxID=1902408 RepID=UPI0037C83E06